MPLNIKNHKVEALATEVSRLTGESKTEAIHRALQERKQRLLHQLPSAHREPQLIRFMEKSIWPKIPRRRLGRKLSKREKERILGYGPAGV
ncbi:MAG TPA: type II toxin-antitoxin system VapB family antitoxin [Acidobacteriota bacterium]